MGVRGRVGQAEGTAGTQVPGQWLEQGGQRKRMLSTSPEPQRTWQTGGKSFDYSDMNQSTNNR